MSHDAEWDRSPNAVHCPVRRVLPVNSWGNVPPGAPTRIASGPVRSPFSIERLVVGGTPSRWVIRDVLIGGRSQIARPIRGATLASSSLDQFLSGADGDSGIWKSACPEAIDLHGDLVMMVSYIGDDPDGEPFVCIVLGSDVQVTSASPDASPPPRG